MTIVLSCVSMIASCIEGKEACVAEPGSMHGRRDMHGREKIFVAIDGRIVERAWIRCFIYTLIFTVR